MDEFLFIGGSYVSTMKNNTLLYIILFYLQLSFPSVELPEKVIVAVDVILMAESAERKEQVAAWTADKKQVSAYAMNLSTD
uniref:Uncharacterized protein n=1 Tax=Nelumbo nucifera TaxID=4432 RepID=A0A822ZPV9_NELNU|nr:TPA_asm: hypothetical protein HUJ06_016790 [Nelumbo nucifera]